MFYNWFEHVWFKHAFDLENNGFWKCGLNKSCSYLCDKVHDIYDVKSIWSQNIFISNMQCSIGYSKYKLLNYKLTQQWHMSCVVLGKGLLPLHP